MNVLVTGAGGFIGTALVQRLLSVNTPLGSIGRLVLVDQRLAGIPADPRVHAIEGDFGDSGVLRASSSRARAVVWDVAAPTRSPPRARKSCWLRARQTSWKKPSHRFVDMADVRVQRCAT